MHDLKPSLAISIRDLRGIDELRKAEAIEKEIWNLVDADVLPLTMSIAAAEAGSIWIGAFDGISLVGFAFGILGLESGEVHVHSHMLGVLPAYQDSDIGYRLKLAQRERALAMRIRDGRGGEIRIHEMTWTFDPLHSRNAHLNFSKLGVVCGRYKPEFYGPRTSSLLHQNGTDRLWVRWPLDSRRVRLRVEGKQNRPEVLDALSVLTPLVRFNAHARPVRSELAAAVARQRIAIEIPSDIFKIEQADPGLAAEWRLHTRWAFSEALSAGFFVAEFCRTVRGMQGPGVYLLEKGSIEDYVPEMKRQ